MPDFRPDPEPLRHVGEQIRARREQLRMSLQRVADASGCTKSYLCEVELGRRAAPSDEVLGRIEHALDVPAGTWVRKASWHRSLRAGGDVVVSELRGLLRAGDAGSISRLRALVGAGEDERTRCDDVVALVHPPFSRGVDIPIINKVPAGVASEFTDLGYPARVADESMRCPGVTDPDAFAARVVGDSMEPEYRAGDIVVFSPAASIIDGCDCFARLEPDQECTFKRVYFEDEGALVRLQPLNSKYQARVVPREGLAGLYAAVRVLRTVLARE